jgi:hypothetical protein
MQTESGPGPVFGAKEHNFGKSDHPTNRARSVSLHGGPPSSDLRGPFLAKLASATGDQIPIAELDDCAESARPLRVHA